MKSNKTALNHLVPLFFLPHHIAFYADMTYRPHKHIPDKERVIAGYVVSSKAEAASTKFPKGAVLIDRKCTPFGIVSCTTFQSALNNPSTTSEGRAHARKQLLKVRLKAGLCFDSVTKRGCPRARDPVQVAYPFLAVPTHHSLRTERTHQGCVFLHKCQHPHSKNAWSKSQAQTLTSFVASSQPT